MDAILERIQKLLALAGSSNEAEAKSAMRKANELLVRYNLDMQQANAFSGDYDFSEIDHGFRARPHQRHILQIINSYFFVNVIHKREYDRDLFRWVHRVVLVGKPANCAIAAHVFEFLSRTYPQLWREFKGQYAVTAKDRFSYYHGLSVGVAEVLNESRMRVEEERGLKIIADKDLGKFTEDYCNGKVRKEKEYKVRAAVAKHGYEDGLNVKIHSSIEHQESNVVPILSGNLK